MGCTVITRTLRIVASLAALSFPAWAPSNAHGEELKEGLGERVAPEESTRLAHGETVTFEETLERPGHHYVGGITYTVVDASASEVTTLLENVRAYGQLLPHTKHARLIGVDGNDFFVELRQGPALLETTYTVRVRREEGGRLFRFWLDPTKPHGIADAWGFFRVSPLQGNTAAHAGPDAPRVLLTYGILVDIGPGLIRDLFEERLRTLVLTVPQLVRQYAFTHFRAGGRA
jgi:hypothetical protein